LVTQDRQDQDIIKKYEIGRKTVWRASAREEKGKNSVDMGKTRKNGRGKDNVVWLGRGRYALKKEKCEAWLLPGNRRGEVAQEEDAVVWGEKERRGGAPRDWVVQGGAMGFVRKRGRNVGQKNKSEQEDKA